MDYSNQFLSREYYKPMIYMLQKQMQKAFDINNRDNISPQMAEEFHMSMMELYEYTQNYYQKNQFKGPCISYGTGNGRNAYT